MRRNTKWQNNYNEVRGPALSFTWASAVETHASCKTAGWEYSEEKEKLIQKRITLGYFPTKDNALKALLNYNESPYDIKTNSIRFSEVYEKWSKEYFPTLSSESSARTVNMRLQLLYTTSQYANERHPCRAFRRCHP